MNFPGGNVDLPGELLLSGRSGPTQVQPPEQPVTLSRMSDAALFRFAHEMCVILETEALSDDADERLLEYVNLLTLQAEREIMRRI